MKKIVHAVFNCKECEKSWENYLNAQTKARQHSKETGHQVNGEVAYSVTYKGKGKKND